MTEKEMGLKVEHEHKPTYDWFTKYTLDNKDFPSAIEFYVSIVKDHLKEYSDYYSTLDDAGLANELSKK